jgi:hypothetical protein
LARTPAHTLSYLLHQSRTAGLPRSGSCLLWHAIRSGVMPFRLLSCPHCLCSSPLLSLLRPSPSGLVHRWSRSRRRRPARPRRVAASAVPCAAASASLCIGLYSILAGGSLLQREHHVHHAHEEHEHHERAHLQPALRHLEPVGVPGLAAVREAVQLRQVAQRTTTTQSNRVCERQRARRTSASRRQTDDQATSLTRSEPAAGSRPRSAAGGAEQNKPAEQRAC